MTKRLFKRQLKQLETNVWWRENSRNGKTANDLDYTYALGFKRFIWKQALSTKLWNQLTPKYLIGYSTQISAHDMYSCKYNICIQ